MPAPSWSASPTSTVLLEVLKAADLVVPRLDDPALLNLLDDDG